MNNIQQPIKSQYDKLNYKAIQLKNNLIVLLISDESTDISAAAMNVNVGMLDEPSDREGLAHFLEHMLFLGTEKYPNYDEYDKFLSQNSGFSNAYTTHLETNYYFDCSNEAFPQALDRFAQFFIKPLFNKELVDREMNAVNSEHEKNIQQDFWREYQLDRHTSKPGSIYNRFGTGNLNTLKHPSIRDDLLQFYDKNYSSNLMKLVIYSNLTDMEELEKLVQVFQEVPNKNYERKHFQDLPFDKDCLAVLYKAVPIQKKDYITFTWILPYLQSHYRSNPGKYLSFILGHEGENSLISMLRFKQLAVELESSCDSDMYLFSQLQIKIELTEQGFENYIKVIEYVAEFIKMLKNRGVQHWLFDEIQQINHLAFDFKDKADPNRIVQKLAQNLQYYSVEDCLRGNDMLEEYDQEFFNSIIDKLTPQNLRVFLFSQKNEKECTETERIYQVKFNKQLFTKEIMDIFNNPQVDQSEKKLDLPIRNIFIPKSLDLHPNPNYPKLVYESDASMLWFKQDNQFLVPKTSFHMQLYTTDNGVHILPSAAVCQQLWLTLFQQFTKELTYLAESTRLQFYLDNDKQPFYIKVNGFNESVYQFIIALFTKMQDYDASKDKKNFEIYHAQMIQDCENFYKQPPYNQGYDYMMYMFFNNGLDDKEFVSECKALTFEKYVTFCENWLKNIRFDFLIVGNNTQEQAIELIKNCENLLLKYKKATPLSKYQVPEQRIINIPIGKTFVWEKDLQPEESNSYIARFYQMEQLSMLSKIKLKLIDNIIEQDFYSKLRTEQQLGYICWSYWRENYGAPMYRLVIQSDVKSPSYISLRFDEYLETQKKKIQEITDEQFDQYRSSVETIIKQKFVSLKEEADNYWDEVLSHQYNFNKKELLLKELAIVKKEDVIDFFMKIFFTERKVYEMHLYSSKHKEEGQNHKKEMISQNPGIVFVEHPELIKNSLPLRPYYFAFK